MGDPQLPSWLVYAIAVLYLAASLCIFGWGVIGLARCYRAWRVWRAARRPPAVTLGDGTRLAARYQHLPADQARVETEYDELYDEGIRIIGQWRQP